MGRVGGTIQRAPQAQCKDEVTTSQRLVPLAEVEGTVVDDKNASFRGKWGSGKNFACVGPGYRYSHDPKASVEFTLQSPGMVTAVLWTCHGFGPSTSPVR